MSYVVRAFKGKEALGKLFWLYGAAICFIFIPLLGVVLFVVGSYASVNAGNSLNMILGLPVMVIVMLLTPILLAYTLWWGVSVWRCAPNATKKWQGVLARVIVILGPGLSLFGQLTSRVTGYDDTAMMTCHSQHKQYALEHSMNWKEDPQRRKYMRHCVEKFKAANGLS
jgi:hypothetical protein